MNNSLNSNQGGTTASVSASVSMPNTPAKRMNPVVVLEECAVDDYAPLFYSPGKCGFYSPREGFASYERLNAFRNVGRYDIEFEITLKKYQLKLLTFSNNRLVGLCLLQNELFPLFLQRHVLKFILGRPIRFHDLAFFDPIVYESLRQLVCEATKSDGNNILANLDLNFV